MVKSKKANPFINGFRLNEEVFAVYARRAEKERRKLVDVIRIALEDHAKELAARENSELATV